MKNIRLFISSRAVEIIAGCYLLTLANIAFAVTEEIPVPEPGPVGLLLLGGVALFIAKFLKRNK